MGQDLFGRGSADDLKQRRGRRIGRRTADHGGDVAEDLDGSEENSKRPPDPEQHGLNHGADL